MLRALGNRIRSQREKRGLKQQDIAHALNISPQAVSKWERGENAPDIAVLGALSRLLDVSTDWLLALHEQKQDVFEATVLVSSVQGAYEKSLHMAPSDFALWANGLFFQLTEIVLRHDGVPVKYIGDGFLCFFSGTKHRERAVRAALRARAMIAEDLRIGLSAGNIYLGAVGHPDYARPDIMGEAVNIAFLTMGWAEKNAKGGIAATESVVSDIAMPLGLRKAQRVNFKGIANPVLVREVKEPRIRGRKP